MLFFFLNSKDLSFDESQKKGFEGSKTPNSVNEKVLYKCSGNISRLMVECGDSVISGQ